MTREELAKMLLIYQYLFMTDKPNKASQEARKKLKHKLRQILTNQEELYNKAKETQQRTYKEAWSNLFPTGKGTYISLGTFMTKLYNSIEKQNLVGHKVMKRMFDSYHHCDTEKELTKQDEVEMEANAHMLAKEVIRLIDGKVESPLARRKYTIEQNLILEGKIT